MNKSPVSGPTRPLMIRAMHPDAYRSGQWARVTGVAYTNEAGRQSRALFLIEFVDGMTDQWPIEDQMARYEFSGTVTA